MNIFTRLPFDVPTTLGVVNASDVISYEDYMQLTQAAEQNAYEHWFFNNTLNGSANNKALTPQSENFTLHDTFVSLNTEIGNALLTDLTHGSAYTACLVVKLKSGYTGSTITQIVGAVDGATSGASMIGFDHANGLGVGPYIIGGGFGTAPRLQNNLDDWQFIAVSFSAAASSVVNTLVADKKNGVQTNQKVSTNSLMAGQKIGLGNGYFSQANGTTVKMQFDCAEFVLFNTAKSQAELEAIYQRAKLRMQFKNILI